MLALFTGCLLLNVHPGATLHIVAAEELQISAKIIFPRQTLELSLEFVLLFPYFYRLGPGQANGGEWGWGRGGGVSVTAGVDHQLVALRK
jgi:hypothetical protein